MPSDDWHHVPCDPRCRALLETRGFKSSAGRLLPCTCGKVRTVDDFEAGRDGRREHFGHGQAPTRSRAELAFRDDLRAKKNDLEKDRKRYIVAELCGLELTAPCTGTCGC